MSEARRRAWSRYGRPMVTTEYLTAADAADLSRRSMRTLARWRRQGVGPRYIRRGAHVLYRRGDVEAWLDAQVHETRDTQAADAQRSA